jgi:hypothetical protein
VRHPYRLGAELQTWLPRPEAVRVVLARAKFGTPSADGESKPLPDDATVAEQDGKRFTIVTAPLPLLLIRRELLAPSMLAHVIVQKFRFGMPFFRFRQEEQLEADGIELDRGTMARSTRRRRRFTRGHRACLRLMTLGSMPSVIRPMPPESRSARSHFQMGGDNPVDKATSSSFWPIRTFARGNCPKSLRSAG